jgi:predicted GIY-YIG superfamily endonuclease
MDEEKDNTIKVYVIECVDNHYYVGITNCLTDTWFHHINGIESIWTKIHKPLRVVTVINEAETHDEFSLIKRYMARFGIEKVRGGNYWQVTLSPSQISNLKDAIKEDKDHEMNQLSDICEMFTLN